MHLVPEGRRALDADRMCQAIGALGNDVPIDEWANRFELLADPTRLALLICVDRAGPISVTDLAGALEIPDTRVSQLLRLLRATGTVSASREGRIVRYRLADPELSRLIEHVAGRPVAHHEHRSRKPR